jgi:hypothetical protein
MKVRRDMPSGTDRYDEASLQRRLWTPVVERPRLGHWFDTADHGTITYATGVSQLADKSGNARHATQATGAQQPVYQPLGLDGQRPAIFCNAISNQFLVLPSIAATGWTAMEAYYVWRNGNDPGGTGVGPALGQFGSDSLGDHEPYSDGNIYHSFGSTARKTVGDPTLLLTSPRLISIRSAANDWQYWIDGTLFFSTVTNTVGLGSTPILMSGNSGPALGYLSEVVTLNTKAGSALSRKIEGYLAWKWGLVKNLPASHISKNQPPLIGG